MPFHELLKIIKIKKNHLSKLFAKYQKFGVDGIELEIDQFLSEGVI
jgi:hypothetical protein